MICGVIDGISKLHVAFVSRVPSVAHVQDVQDLNDIKVLPTFGPQHCITVLLLLLHAIAHSHRSTLQTRDG